MRKIISIISLSILTLLVICITYLSIYGIKTERFNSFINSKVKEYNPKLILKLDSVFIKLNLSQSSININTKDTILVAERNPISISNIDINLSLLKFFKKKKLYKKYKNTVLRQLNKQCNFFFKHD